MERSVPATLAGDTRYKLKPRQTIRRTDRNFITRYLGVNSVAPKAVISPPHQQVREGEPVEFRCEATGNPPPQLDWIRVHGSMSPEATFYNGIWSLPAASKNDAAEYKCIARNNVGTDEKTTILYVQGTKNRSNQIISQLKKSSYKEVKENRRELLFNTYDEMMRIPNLEMYIHDYTCV